MCSTDFPTLARAAAKMLCTKPRERGGGGGGGGGGSRGGGGKGYNYLKQFMGEKKN